MLAYPMSKRQRSTRRSSSRIQEDEGAPRQTFFTPHNQTFAKRQPATVCPATRQQTLTQIDFVHRLGMPVEDSDLEYEQTHISSASAAKRRRISNYNNSTPSAASRSIKRRSLRLQHLQPEDIDSNTVSPKPKLEDPPQHAVRPAEELMPPPKTPRKNIERVVPSSQSPALTPLSLRSQRYIAIPPQSPLKELSTNVWSPSRPPRAIKKVNKQPPSLEVKDTYNETESSELSTQASLSRASSRLSRITSMHSDVCSAIPNFQPSPRPSLRARIRRNPQHLKDKVGTHGFDDEIETENDRGAERGMEALGTLKHASTLAEHGGLSTEDMGLPMSKGTEVSNTSDLQNAGKKQPGPADRRLRLPPESEIVKSEPLSQSQQPAGGSSIAKEASGLGNSSGRTTASTLRKPVQPKMPHGEKGQHPPSSRRSTRNMPQKRAIGLSLHSDHSPQSKDNEDAEASHGMLDTAEAVPTQLKPTKKRYGARVKKGQHTSPQKSKTSAALQEIEAEASQNEPRALKEELAVEPPASDPSCEVPQPQSPLPDLRSDSQQATAQLEAEYEQRTQSFVPVLETESQFQNAWRAFSPPQPLLEPEPKLRQKVEEQNPCRTQEEQASKQETRQRNSQHQHEVVLVASSPPRHAAASLPADSSKSRNTRTQARPSQATTADLTQLQFPKYVPVPPSQATTASIVSSPVRNFSRKPKTIPTQALPSSPEPGSFLSTDTPKHNNSLTQSSPSTSRRQRNYNSTAQTPILIPSSPPIRPKPEVEAESVFEDGGLGTTQRLKNLYGFKPMTDSEMLPESVMKFELPRIPGLGLSQEELETDHEYDDDDEL